MPLHADAVDRVGVVREPHLVEVPEGPEVDPATSRCAEHQLRSGQRSATPAIACQVACTTSTGQSDWRSAGSADEPGSVTIRLASHLRYDTPASMPNTPSITEATCCLNIGATQVELELESLESPLTAGLGDDPVGVVAVERGGRVDHLRFDPHAEADAGLRSGASDGFQPVGQLASVDHPVAQSGLVVVTRELVAEPAVVEQEQLGPDLGGLGAEACEARLVEREPGRLPVVRHDRAWVGRRPAARALASSGGGDG